MAPAHLRVYIILCVKTLRSVSVWMVPLMGVTQVQHGSLGEERACTGRGRKGTAYHSGMQYMGQQ